MSGGDCWNGGDDGSRTRGLCLDSLGIHGLSATYNLSGGCQVADKDCRNRSLWVILWARILAVRNDEAERYFGSRPNYSPSNGGPTSFMPCLSKRLRSFTLAPGLLVSSKKLSILAAGVKANSIRPGCWPR